MNKEDFNNARARISKQRDNIMNIMTFTPCIVNGSLNSKDHLTKDKPFLKDRGDLCLIQSIQLDVQILILFHLSVPVAH